MAQKLTMMVKERVEKVYILKHNIGFWMRPLLVLDWHVRAARTGLGGEVAIQINANGLQIKPKG